LAGNVVLKKECLTWESDIKATILYTSILFDYVVIWRSEKKLCDYQIVFMPFRKSRISESV